MVKRLNFIKASQLCQADAVMSMVLLSGMCSWDDRETCSIRVHWKCGGRSHRASLNMSLKNLSRIYAVYRRALSISREHLRLHRLQRLTRMWHVNCTTQNPAADIESFLFSAHIWKAFVRCLPSAGLISKRQRKSEACLFFPAQSMERAAHCLGSHQAFKNGGEARKKVRVGFFFPWGPAERADHPLPPSSKLKCQLLIKPLSIATYNQLPMLLKTP